MYYTKYSSKYMAKQWYYTIATSKHPLLIAGPVLGCGQWCVSWAADWQPEGWLPWLVGSHLWQRTGYQPTSRKRLVDNDYWCLTRCLVMLTVLTSGSWPSTSGNGSRIGYQWNHKQIGGMNVRCVVGHHNRLPRTYQSWFLVNIKCFWWEIKIDKSPKLMVDHQLLMVKLVSSLKFRSPSTHHQRSTAVGHAEDGADACGASGAGDLHQRGVRGGCDTWGVLGHLNPACLRRTWKMWWVDEYSRYSACFG